jgi:DNA-directed RNA polymerase I, II, and III subunit RPABC1
MDFENIFKSRKNILKLLTIRGYDVSAFKNQTKEELNILYQNHNKKVTYDIDTLDIFIKDETRGNILIKYVLSEKCRAKVIEKIMETLYTDFLENNDTCIIVTKEKVTYKGSLETFINKIYKENKQFGQIFSISDFLYDITEHELCPKYQILTEEEKEEVLKMYNAELKQIPELPVDDALGSFYGVRVNQMVKITFSSQTAGITNNYRVCTV